ncbi:NAD(P)/FAD-dependent oxidoreductase [Streptomyces sp. GMR22]|uniref:NAD(P)/FAD-dependent oxidoreductase n=1 Tax=Streptomyces sp. GMR22 TaxID=2759524 RepID=UPI0015FA0476|nr:FAD-dependent oxidoreductase [Streptomyces sp. GMR22]MBA6440760.1 FAD-binding oxidoreductase [Streptomyces sp. GMR22]
MRESVLVVGSGLVGASTAYFAAREGINVTLLEQEERAYGASGRNPGFVWLHCRNPGWALDVSLAGRALYDELKEDLPVPFEFRAEGGLIYFTDERQAPVFEQFVEARRKDGLEMSLIDNAEVRKLVGPIRKDVLGASFCASDAQIKTPTVVNALVEGALAEGATVHEGVEVTRLIASDGRVIGVETADGGTHMADTVVIATGAWTEKLMAANDVDARVGRERLQVIATKPLPRQIKPVVYGPLTAKQYALFRHLPAWDENAFITEEERRTGSWQLSLVAQRADGEMLFGCPMDYPADVDMTTSVSGLRSVLQYIERDFPGLAGAPIDRVWAGVLPFTSDMVPIVDEVMPGLIVAAGHVFGNSSGPMTGKLVSQMLCDRTPEMDMSELRYNRPLDPIVPGRIVHW